MPHIQAAKSEDSEKLELLHWLNSHLNRCNYEAVSSLEGAIADGITLIRICRAILNEEPPRHAHRPVVLIQRVENLQVAVSWLRDRGVSIPNIHIEDLASNNTKSALALCRALKIYDVAHSNRTGRESRPSPPTPPESTTYSKISGSNLDKDDIAILGWLGSVVEQDVTDYQALTDGNVLCKLFMLMAPGSLDENVVKKPSIEKLEAALNAAEKKLSISRGLLDVGKLSQGKEDSYKLFSYLQRCQITQKQIRRQEFMRQEKEKASANTLTGHGGSPDVEMRGRSFGTSETRESRRMAHRSFDGSFQSKLSGGSSSVPASPEMSNRGRSSSPNRAGNNEYMNQWSSRHQHQHQSEHHQEPQHKEMEDNSKSGNSSEASSMGGQKVYPPPYDHPPPPPQSTSGGEQHPYIMSPSPIPPRGVSFRQKGPSMSAPSSPLVSNRRASASEEKGDSEKINESQFRGKLMGKEPSPQPSSNNSSLDHISNMSEAGSSLDSNNAQSSTREETPTNSRSPPTRPPPPLPERGASHNQQKSFSGNHSKPETGGGSAHHKHSLSQDETDTSAPMSVLRQHLLSSSHPQHIQSHFMSRLELLEHELTEVRERLDAERFQFTHKLQEHAAEEEKKRKSIEKEFKKLSDLARQLTKHYDACFVNIARQMAQIQDKIGLEVEESIGALVGDVFQSENKPVNAKQLIDEISSLKQQINSLTGCFENTGQVSSGSTSVSPPTSAPLTPEPLLSASPDTSSVPKKKTFFVRKKKNGQKKDVKTEPVRTTSSGSSEIPVVELAHQANITHTSHKKLTKFFGEDIPKVENLQTFLNRLGYPELMNIFSKEHVTLTELHLMSEQHLAQMGIPMGPRVAIVAELKQLESVSIED